ncbi:Mur ligase [Capnocytophaga sp.]|uniref:Mur ligase n=1 Tax=Capnocytophaga sp. TaxID=44737 RepID=UPI0026DC7D82|nr:Mur ligase [Capnocytophaga sp.]MDO5106054.1 Mur ligase [Capnocytophaga sp.]
MHIHFIVDNDPVLQKLSDELSKINTVTFSDEQMSQDIDFVVVSKSISDNDLRLQKAKNLQLNLLSHTEFIYEYFKNQTRVVIASGSGKASVTAMVLHVMAYYDNPVSYFTENQSNERLFNFSEDAEFTIIETDENTIANSTSQADFFHPTVILIDSNLTDKNTEKYTALINNITKGGILIYNQENQLVNQIVSASENAVRKIAYQTPDYQLIDNVIYLSTDEGELPLENITNQEVINVEGAKWLCQNMGIDAADFYQAMVSF